MSEFQPVVTHEGSDQQRLLSGVQQEHYLFREASEIERRKQRRREATIKCYSVAISAAVFVTVIYLICVVVANWPRTLWFSGQVLGVGDSLPGKLARLSMASNRRRSGSLKTHLRLVSVLSRHGDRAPTGDFAFDDKFASQADKFWPHGRGNLTDSGRFRMFRLGLELRKRYEDFLDFDASHFLAFSSERERCNESLKRILSGLFQMDGTVREGLDFVRRHLNGTLSKLSTGSGSPLEFEKIALDTGSVPSLSYHKVIECLSRNQTNESRAPALENLKRKLKSLKGFDGLDAIFRQRYNFSSSIADEPVRYGKLWSTLKIELQLRRTVETISYGQHYYDWIVQQVPEYANSTTTAPVTYFDLAEQVAAITLSMAYDIIAPSDDRNQRIQLGTILSSLLASQTEALNFVYDSNSTRSYTSTKMILYSTHDIVVQKILGALAIARPSASEFEQNFKEWHTGSDADQLLAGLQGPKFGISLAFELYETVNEHTQEKLNHLQLALYNEEDPKYKPVEYKRLNLGLACRQLFEAQNPSASANAFYSPRLIDATLSCPFDLFKNVTSALLMSAPEFRQICEEPK